MLKQLTSKNKHKGITSDSPFAGGKTEQNDFCSIRSQWDGKHVMISIDFSPHNSARSWMRSINGVWSQTEGLPGLGTVADLSDEDKHCQTELNLISSRSPEQLTTYTPSDPFAGAPPPISMATEGSNFLFIKYNWSIDDASNDCGSDDCSSLSSLPPLPSYPQAQLSFPAPTPTPPTLLPLPTPEQYAMAVDHDRVHPPPSQASKAWAFTFTMVEAVETPLMPSPWCFLYPVIDDGFFGLGVLEEIKALKEPSEVDEETEDGVVGGTLPNIPVDDAVAGVGEAGPAAYAHHQARGQQAGAGAGRAPLVVSSSQSSNGPGGMMMAGRLAKEREAYGHHGPSARQQQQQPQGGGGGTQFGAGPGPAAVGSMVGGGGPAQGQRRFSGSEGDGSGSGSGGRYSGAGYEERGMVVWHNPDMDEEGGQGGYAGGWSEEARRMSLAGRPGAQQGPSGGKPAPRDGPNPSSVLVHRDGGRVPEPQQPETPEGLEEIPLTYDSLVLDGDERPRNGKGVGGTSGMEGGASGNGQRRE
ncbi:hypothetical protein K435DRAFT_840384 [Dendrothele bispora CBS 962.96]|uniref:Uncharacterized protein n=1 Tax=Dendrothele bispora (strain CBS 962.96) TaxID=1314807 RepID=A0A4S8LUP4_DENBC|nr:hypothetical protein K435DRAFT_840384 [Dendrothele bispora CBS 962.96]